MCKTPAKHLHYGPYSLQFPFTGAADCTCEGRCGPGGRKTEDVAVHWICDTLVLSRAEKI